MDDRNTNRLWLKGPASDLLIGSGGWSLPLIAITLLLSQDNYGTLSLAFYFLALFCNNPHYMATLYRAYGHKNDLERYKFFSIYITAIIALSGVVAHLSPALVPLLFTIYLIWSPWHYTGQNFGIAMMFLRRGSASPTKTERNTLYASYFGSYLVWVVELDQTQTQDAMTLTLGLPAELAISLKLLGYLVFAGGAAYSFISLTRKNASRALAAPLLLHASQFLWFLLPGLLRSFHDQDYPATYFSAGILAFMHCAQYLWITSYYAKRETEQSSQTARSAWNPFKYFTVLILGGIALFVPGPWIVSKVFGHDLFESALIFIALVNIHHFMLDGAIWKLRDGRIARLLLGSKQKENKTSTHVSNTLSIRKFVFGKTLASRALRYGTATLLIGFAVIDQLQNIFTASSSNTKRVEIARQFNENDSRVYFRSAKLSIAASDTSKAIAELKRAIELNPRNIAALHTLAQLHMLGNELDQSQMLYQQILDISANDYSALNNLGLLAYNDSDFTKALALFQHAYQVDPDSWKTRAFVGSCLTRLHQHEGAIPFLESCLPHLDQIKNGSESERLQMILPDLSACYQATGRPQDAQALKALLP